jgi:Flp pilus assembly protein protease CpaA
MNGTAILTMVLICGLVWGGFVTLVILALRRERAKGKDAGCGST